MPPEIAVIVPVCNEAENVVPLARQIATALSGERRPFEVVFVDDGSTDATWERIRAAHDDDPRVRGLRHARQSGQSTALWTGLQATGAPIVATLDGDLQNDPADLPRLLALLAEVDFVCGNRTHRQDPFLRRASSQVARWARRLVFRIDFQDTGCALRVFRRRALAGIFPFNGWHRFLPLLVHASGVSTREVPVNHRPRAAGVSKYGLWDRLGRGMLDLVGVAWYQRRRLPAVPVAGFEDRPGVPLGDA